MAGSWAITIPGQRWCVDLACYVLCCWCWCCLILAVACADCADCAACDQTNFEIAVRVPLIVRAPLLAGSAGKVSTELVEAVDM